MFQTQADYEAFYSPEAIAARTVAAREVTDKAVAEAWQLCNDGDREAARQRLITAGLSDEGVAYYLQSWD